MIQRKTITAELYRTVKTDSLLKPSEALEKVCNFKVCIYPITGNIAQNQFINTTNSTHIGITRQRGIKERMTVMCGNKKYNVTFVNEEGRNTQLYLEKVEV